MRKLLIGLATMFGCLSAQTAAAQDFCADLRGIVEASRTEFAQFIGDPVPDPSSPNLAIFLGTHALAGRGTCAVAQQNSQGRRYSTSYTCAGAGADTAAGLQGLLSRITQCLEINTWAEQAPQGRGPMLTQYGLVRLTITYNGDA